MSVNKKHEIISQHGNFEVVIDHATGMKALFSKFSYKEGDVIIKFSAKEILPDPTYLTVQLDDHRHILMEPEFIQFANHSCDPNFFIDTERMEFIALRDIHVGDELLFFYPSTEWKMDRPFQCQCGSPECIGLVSGAFTLTPEARKKYRLSKYVLGKLNESYSTIISSAKR